MGWVASALALQRGGAIIAAAQLTLKFPGCVRIRADGTGRDRELGKAGTHGRLAESSRSPDARPCALASFLTEFRGDILTAHRTTVPEIEGLYAHREELVDVPTVPRRVGMDM